MDDAIRHTGGFSRFQYKAGLMFSGTMTTGSFALYPMTFYELQPAYLCKSISDATAEWISCKAEGFCDRLDTIEFKIDQEDSLSLVNWVTDYGMTCSPKYQFGLFGSLFFIAVVISSILFTPLAD